jgi:PAS domain S-box-containing protein
MTHVLIVDDKEENLYYLEALLKGHGCRVETARHGAEALVLARKAPPDLVISDLLMPVMDGYTLLRHWKSDARLKAIPFIVYTATYTEMEDERLALNLGADAFILKPAEPEEFLARIREVQANVAAAIPALPRHPVGDENDLLKVYSETLIRKLEEKSLQLEAANQALKQDIINRQLAEVSLRESEQRFRQLAENINEVFWITDPAKSQMLYVSPAYEKIWGRSCAELYASPGSWLEAIHAEDRERIAAATTTKQLQGGYDEVYRIVRPGGEIRWIRDRAFPVANDQGENYRVVGTAEDITERKKLEAQFLRAQRMESIGTLAGGIAHDLNNVLAPILMSVEMLKGLASDKESLMLLSTLETSARRGADMVKQVLSFARGVEGQRVRVNPIHLMRELIQVMKESFPKTIQVSFTPARELWTVTGDPTQLHQVFLNLCVNARDSMPDGGCLTISMENATLDETYAAMNPESRPGSYVVVKVKDTGTGIPAPIRDRIFEPFFTTKEIGKGTGLGLSTTIAIVQNHGGFISLRSEVGNGTTFEVFLPADTAETAMDNGVRADAQLPRGHGELILVVDDEEAIRNVARKTLERFGYRVMVASNGAEAMAVYANHPQEIAVVVTDMAMPIMDGPALAIALASINPQVRIIGSSGLHTNETVARASGASVQHFVPKPYTAETLLKKLAEVLQAPALGK